MHQIIVIVVFWMLHTSGAYGSLIKETSQYLSANCTQAFKKAGECLSRDLVADKTLWGGLNNSCCRQYPGTSLHCQHSISDNDIVNIFIACLPQTWVPKGHFGVLEKNLTGHPVLKLYTCNTRNYEPDGRLSDHPTVSICRYFKSKCNGTGQRRLCLGGPTRDDFCMCVDGYRPHPDNEQCGKGDFRDGEPLCTCELYPCPQRTVRNIPNLGNVSCDDIDSKMDYSCHQRSDVPGNGNLFNGNQGPTPPSDGGSGQPPANTTNSAGLPAFNGSSGEIFALRITVGFITSALVFSVCWNFRKNIWRSVCEIRRKVCERRARKDAGTATPADEEKGTDDEESEVTSLSSSSGAT